MFPIIHVVFLSFLMVALTSSHRQPLELQKYQMDSSLFSGLSFYMSHPLVWKSLIIEWRVVLLLDDMSFTLLENHLGERKKILMKEIESGIC